MWKLGSGEGKGGDGGEKQERGMFGDMMGKMKSSAEKFTGGGQAEGSDTAQKPQGGQSGSFFDKMNASLHEAGRNLNARMTKQDEAHTHTHGVDQCSDGSHNSSHRFQSFAPQRTGNQVKWYVDGCSYFYAVSLALEHARESVWILDWWLSPEVYLRRPPALNEQYRLDRMLRNAAERGVKVRVIVYKEVTQALTLSSSHTKHALEDMHPNITVLRHPDHLPDKHVLAKNFMSSFSNLNLTAATASKLPGDALKSIYGMNDDAVLYWAHHEKLCVVDGDLAFMGGLDLCYGRWDTHNHPIADVHPGDLNQIVFPGQDYNNARVMDFQDVVNWQNNKLDRKYNSRMGWSDMSISLLGPVVEDLKAHFAQRWNFIYYEKYDVRNQTDRHQPIAFEASHIGILNRDAPDEGQHHFRQRLRQEYEEGRGRLADQTDQWKRRYLDSEGGMPGSTPCQIMRSCCKWSHGGSVEHSIADAYITAIRDSKHFIYIENQFFITATDDQQKPIKNKLGAAMVERIVRAARNNENYHIIVVMPAVPAFAGDLKADDAISTRAIMEFQYFSINRGGHSIYESLANQGIDPMRYIRFYNLRNYDRINSSDALKTAEQQSGISYDDARRGHDQKYGAGYGGNPQQQSQEPYGQPNEDIQNFNQFQDTAKNLGSQGGLASGRYDTISSAYMLNQPSLFDIPWTGSPESEIDAFVSEELYVHSKLLIADDRLVICGSANLNDRSQLGTHDSEIAICIEDPETIDSTMDGRPYQASRFAASLRRFIFRKHLGLVPPQDYTNGRDPNFAPVNSVPVNEYDWGSHEDHLVTDPLGEEFKNLWNGTAYENTQAFEKVFHPVPSDKARTWEDYESYYSKYFPLLKEDSKEQEKKADEQKIKEKGGEPARPSTWKMGHVVAEEFSPGAQGAREVKEVLARIRGTLVEMPLLFMDKEDFAKEGMSLNAFTEEVFT
ncbi:Phospholipase D1 [Elsinoe australis]|uniref:Phospholipase n=1 Tax=Elsinoe australis TaxID=40998 RepID=A0A2P7Z7P8_9PEZI|nr:Phospholipase D1 [Elsinoe australis]